MHEALRHYSSFKPFELDLSWFLWSSEFEQDGAKILKEWYAYGVPETTTLIDVYLEFSLGFLDNSFPLADEYRTSVELGGEHRQNVVVFLMKFMMTFNDIQGEAR